MALTAKRGSTAAVSGSIQVRDLGIRFKRNRSSRRSFKDLFAGSSRRSRPNEFWALRGVSFDVAPG
ncbi:MAG: ABC transporter ATP-binding protein, partial [Microbacteriaceae bacterium]